MQPGDAKQPSEGMQPGQSDESSDSQKPGAGNTPSSSSKSGQGGKSGPGNPSELPDGKGSDDGTSAPAGEEANPEFQRQAAELVLQKLKDELERGDVSPELLEELGWTKEQTERFVERMSQELNRSKTESPESEARRLQFEEMLKNLNVKPKASTREATEQPSREVEQVDSRRRNVPAEYRKAWERYTERLNKQRPGKTP